MKYFIAFSLLLSFILLSPASMLAAGKPKEFPEQMTDTDIDKNDSQWQCEQFILQTLDDPYKAKFEYFGNFPASKTPDGTIKVTATYALEEGGAKKKAECTLKKSPSGDWQLVGIKNLP